MCQHAFQDGISMVNTNPITNSRRLVVQSPNSLIVTCNKTVPNCPLILLLLGIALGILDHAAQRLV